MSHLSTVAATLGAGQFGQLTVPGYDIAFTNSGAGGAMGFASKAAYSCETALGSGGSVIRGRRAFFLGGGHNQGVPAPTKFWSYEVESNTVTLLPTPSWVADPVNAFHSYQHLAINPGLRKFYYRISNALAVHRCDLDEDDVNDIETWDAYDNLPAAFTSRCAIEFFPEMNALVALEPQNGYIYTHNDATGSSWTLRATTGLAVTDGTFALYNPVHKHMLFGGGSGASISFKMYKMGSDGSVTQLTDLPAAAVGISASSVSLPFIDPISGNLVVINKVPLDNNSSGTAYDVWEMDPATVDATSGRLGVWTHRTDLISAIPHMAASTFSLFNVTCVSLWDLGVILFFGTSNIYIYKHTANTRATTGLTWSELDNIPGRLGSLKGESQQELIDLRYQYNTLDAALSAAIAAKGYGPSYSISGVRNSGEAAVVATAHYDETTFTIPEVDAVSPPAGSNGSIRFDIPNKCGGAQGYIQICFDQQLGLGSNFPYIAPGSTKGQQVYMRYMHKISASVLNTDYNAVEASFLVITAAPGSRQVILYSGTGVFTQSHVGRTIGFQLPEDGGNSIVRGFYAIESVQDGEHATLTTSPSPLQAGTATRGFISSGGATRTYGEKLDIMFGSPPFGGSSGALEFTTIDQQQSNYPDLYGSSGNDAPPNPFPQQVKAMVADTWQVFVKRCEPRLPSYSQVSLGELWIDGIRVRRWELLKLAQGGNESPGLWQSQLLTYMTGKDPSQATADGSVRYAQVLWSTQPIPQDTTASGGAGASTITSISPSSANAGTTQPVTITGTGFSVDYQGGDAQLVFTGSGISATNVVVVSDTEITANFVLESTASGARVVKVRTDNGLSSPYGTFTINALENSHFGYDVIGQAQANFSPGYLIVAGPFVMPQDGDTTNIWANFTSTGLEDVTLGIYGSTAGYPAALIADTDGGAFAAGSGWKSRPITAHLVAGATYWLAIESSSVIPNIRYDVLANKGRFVASAYVAGTLPGTYPVGATVLNEDPSIYVEYVPGSSTPSNPTRRTRKLRFRRH